MYSLDVLNETDALNPGKNSSGPIPTLMLKCVSVVCYEEITGHINKSFEINKLDGSKMFKTVFE